MPFDRQIDDPRRVTDGRASQQPAAERIEPERGDGTGQCHAVELFFLVAIDDSESGNVTPESLATATRSPQRVAVTSPPAAMGRTVAGWSAAATSNRSCGITPTKC